MEFFVDSNQECDEIKDKKFLTKTIDLKLLGGKKNIALNIYAVEQKIAGLIYLIATDRYNVIYYCIRVFSPSRIG